MGLVSPRRALGLTVGITLLFGGFLLTNPRSASEPAPDVEPWYPPEAVDRNRLTSGATGDRTTSELTRTGQAAPDLRVDPNIFRSTLGLLKH